MLRRVARLVTLLCITLSPTQAQETAWQPTPSYDMGTPFLIEVYVDPANGSDSNSGASANDAFATLDFAWRQIQAGVPLASGVRINLAPGNYPSDNVPVYMESRYGTYDAPIVIQAATRTATLASLNVYDVRYFYLIGLTIEDASDNVFHCEKCDHLLLRDVSISGPAPDTYASKETVKVNQSQYIYIEDSDISGAWDNAVDFVAVQYGHVLGSRLHSAGDWCIYAKGGSAYLYIERNTLYDCGTGGFTAGQGTGFQFMTPPWLHYEAYDVQFVDNILYDIDGAAFGVQGAYNVVIAFNTAYRVGARSHVIEAGFGGRSCDGTPDDDSFARCGEYLAEGGWGNTRISDGNNFTRIPNRHVYIVNNIIYNPQPVQSQWQHLQVFAPYGGEFQVGSNVPLPARADDDLIIAGNIIWNGPANHPVGIEEGAGCAAENASCNLDQLRRDNAINTIEPVLADPKSGDFSLRSGDRFSAVGLPDLVWDLPYTNVPRGGQRNLRGAGTIPGALHTSEK